MKTGRRCLAKVSGAAPTIIDRRGDVADAVAGGELPPVVFLGAGCWATEGNPFAWRLGIRLLFSTRPPSIRLIWRDYEGRTFEDATARLTAFFAGGIITAIEIWSARRMDDPPPPTADPIENNQ